MTTRYYLDGIEVVGKIRNRATNTPGGGLAGLTSSAQGGSFGSGGVEIDDPAGTLDIKGWRPFYVEEDEATPSRIWTGFIGGRRIGQADLFEAPGVACVWDCDLMDLNVILGLKVFEGAAANRPAESDLTRIGWMLANWPAPDWPVFDNGAVTLGANFGTDDLRDKFPEEVLASMALNARMFYLYWDETAASGEEISLLYDVVTAVRGNATVSLSNDPNEIDGSSCFQALNGMSVNREPAFTYSDVIYKYPAGRIHQFNATTRSTYINRDQVYQNDRAVSATTASTQVTALLAQGSTERDILTCDVILSNDQVNLIREGYRINVKFTHILGYKTTTAVTIQKRTIRRPDNGALDRYIVSLELSNVTPAATGGGDPGGLPLPTTCVEGTGELVSGQQVSGTVAGTPESISLPSAPTVGNTVIVYQTSRGAVSDTPDGFTDCGVGEIGPVSDTLSGHYGRVSYRLVQTGDTAAIQWAGGIGHAAPGLVYAEERVGQLTPVATSLVSADPYNTNSPFPGSAITPDSGRLGAITGYWFAKRDHGALSADTGWTLLDAATTSAVITHAAIEKVVTSTSGTYTPSFTGANPAVFDNHGYGAITLELLCANTDNPPTTGQWVKYEVVGFGDGTTTTFTTQFPYAAGSLTVWVDGVEIVNGLTETDPSAGTFTLDFAPLGAVGDSAAERITCKYQGI